MFLIHSMDVVSQVVLPPPCEGVEHKRSKFPWSCCQGGHGTALTLLWYCWFCGCGGSRPSLHWLIKQQQLWQDVGDKKQEQEASSPPAPISMPLYVHWCHLYEQCEWLMLMRSWWDVVYELRDTPTVTGVDPGCSFSDFYCCLCGEEHSRSMFHLCTLHFSPLRSFTTTQSQSFKSCNFFFMVVGKVSFTYLWLSEITDVRLQYGNISSSHWLVSGRCLLTGPIPVFSGLPNRISNGRRPLLFLTLALIGIKTISNTFVNVKPVSSQHLTSFLHFLFLQPLCLRGDMHSVVSCLCLDTHQFSSWQHLEMVYHCNCWFLAEIPQHHFSD